MKDPILRRTAPMPYLRAHWRSDRAAVCGVHWKSDVEAGRIIGSATVSRLHSNPVFVAELAEACKEIASARGKGAEAKALAFDRE